MRTALGTLIVAIVAVAALSFGGSDLETDRCSAPFPDLQDMWIIDHPECAGQP